MALFLAVWNCDKVLKLASVQDLSSFGFFVKSTIAEYFVFSGRAVCQRLTRNTRTIIPLTDDNKQDAAYDVCVHVRPDGLACTVITRHPAEERESFALIKNCMRTFEQEHPTWAQVVTDQDWSLLPSLLIPPPDKLKQTQEALDDIKEIMHKNIEEVLNRGEKLESLMEKSHDLSQHSLTFYRQAKKQNQCCKAF